MNAAIYVVLFCVSFSYMSLEMLAGRMLNPYFGSSMFTWGSIISVFLAGSSLGYWIGGRESDASHPVKLIQKNFINGSIVIAVLPLLSRIILPVLQEWPSPWGGLIGSAVLFMSPNMFLSALIPSITKLGLTLRFSGSRIGTYHAVSAAGSIVGTLVATFLLIPQLSIPIVLAVTLFIFQLAFMVFMFVISRHVFMKSLAIPLLILVPLVTGQSIRFSNAKVVAQVSSPYHDIFITEGNSYRGNKGNFRFLQFDQKANQGVLDLDHPDRPIVPYVKSILELLEANHPGAQTYYMVGHGIGTLSSVLRQQGKNVLVSEIDAKVVEVSKVYFGYSGNDVRIGDGRVILQSFQDRSQDVIILDAYNGGTIPFHLTTQEFFRLTSRKLKDDGILMLNVIGKTENDAFTESMYTTVSSIYPYVKVIPMDKHFTERQNMIFIASPQPFPAMPTNEMILNPGEIMTDLKAPIIDVNY